MQFQEEEDYTKRFDLALWKRVLVIAKNYRGKLGLICLFMAGCAGADVVYPLITRHLIDNFITVGRTDGLPLVIAGYALLVALQATLVWSFIRKAGEVEVYVTYDIRKEAFKRLQELSMTWYDKTPVGFVMARMNSDASRLGEAMGWVLVDLLWGFSYIVFTATTMLILQWKLALIVMCTVPILAVISMYFQKKILAAYRVVRKTNSKITGSFNEGITGARTSKTLVREERNAQEFQELTGTMRRYSVRAANLSALFYPIVATLGAVGAALALTRGGNSVAAGALSLGTLIVFLQYGINFFNPIRDIARIFADLQSTQAAAERVMSLLGTHPDLVDTPEAEETYGTNFAPKRENWETLKGDVALEGVTFRYKDGETVLNDFSLNVHAGQTIALVGETGSGKSTIVNLICRFYEPTEGRVLIDGRDIRQRSQLWLQENLGYVLQQPHLFSGTIRDNIRYGKLSATDEEVERAAQLVNADGFIKKLEKGYDTNVGEGGGRLSTGEKQLVSFARAILANPRIFVLDEATSSVDTETEQLIQHAIQRVLTGRTSFIIAHRLSTVRKADRILVIHDGKIIEDGDHRALIKARGTYYTLYTNQFVKEREAAVLGLADSAQ